MTVMVKFHLPRHRDNSVCHMHLNGNWMYASMTQKRVTQNSIENPLEQS